MNFSDALATGKRIRRPGYDKYIQFEDKMWVSAEDAAATDWEVEPDIISFECDWVIAEVDGNQELEATKIKNSNIDDLSNVLANKTATMTADNLI